MRHLDMAKYLLENGYTTLADELGSYNFPKELDKCFDVYHADNGKLIDSHPFLLDEMFDKEEFMAYLVTKGLDVNVYVSVGIFEPESNPNPFADLFIDRLTAVISLNVTLHCIITS